MYDANGGKLKKGRGPWGTILVVIVVWIIFSLFSENSSKSKWDSLRQAESSKEVSEENEEVSTESKETTKESKEPETDGEEVTQVFIETVEIYNGNGVKIFADEVEVNQKKTTFTFSITNESETDYSISVHSYDINGLMAGTNLYGMGSVNVPTGKKAKITIDVNNDWFADSGISVIQSLNVIFWAYADYYKQWDTGLLSVYTNFYEEDSLYMPNGEEVYSDDNITLWYNGGLSFTMLNKSNYHGGYTVENCSINDWSYELTKYTYDLYNEEIHSNSYAIFEIPVESDFMREMGMESVENIEFDIQLEDSYWDFSGEKWKHTTGKILLEFE